MTQNIEAHTRAIVGEQIKRIRLLAGLSQVQLAAAIGVKQACISRAESGRHNLTTDLLGRIVRATGGTITIK